MKQYKIQNRSQKKNSQSCVPLRLGTEASKEYEPRWPDPIVMKNFTPRKGLEKGLKKVLSSCPINLPHLP